MECAAILDALGVPSALDETRDARGRERLEREVAMLTRLSR
jgi:hypothetical protein